MKTISRIYFDNAATTRVAPEVLAAMLPYMDNMYGNASSMYEEGRMARVAVETSRRTVAKLLGCNPNEIVFTSGGTESNNMALRCGIHRITQIITSRLEHPSVLNTSRALAQTGRISQLSYVRTDRDGAIDLDDLEKLLRDSGHRTLVSLMHANNETGRLTNIKAVGELCRKYLAYFHSDCVQTIGHLPINLSDLPVDMASASAHKFHGPKGTGILFIREGEKMAPMITGGGHERGLRAGTENVAGIVGFAKALEIAMNEFEEEMPRILQIKRMLAEKLSAMSCRFNGGDPAEGSYTILNAGFPKETCTSSLLLDLDQAGFSVSSGSACSAGKGSHVMEELNAEETVNIRFSFSKYNSPAEVALLIPALEKAVFCYSQ